MRTGVAAIRTAGLIMHVCGGPTGFYSHPQEASSKTINSNISAGSASCQSQWDMTTIVTVSTLEAGVGVVHYVLFKV